MGHRWVTYGWGIPYRWLDFVSMCLMLRITMMEGYIQQGDDFFVMLMLK